MSSRGQWRMNKQVRDQRKERAEQLQRHKRLWSANTAATVQPCTDCWSRTVDAIPQNASAITLKRARRSLCTLLNDLEVKVNSLRALVCGSEGPVLVVTRIKLIFIDIIIWRTRLFFPIYPALLLQTLCKSWLSRGKGQLTSDGGTSSEQNRTGVTLTYLRVLRRPTF